MKRNRWWTLTLALVVGASGVLAQPEDIERLSQRALGAAATRDYPRAEQLFREWAVADMENFVPVYNLACMLSLQGKGEEAMQSLRTAIERGFVDVYRLRSDPDLSGVRTREDFQTLVKSWSDVLDARASDAMAGTKLFFANPKTPGVGGKGHYQEFRDPALRLIYWADSDATSFAKAREDITRLGQWGLATIFPDLKEGGELDPWVIVVLPQEKHFLKWAVAQYGDDAIRGGGGIGGAYSHDDKRLVAMDLGPTLRHEFFHVLHWRSSTRKGQDHPVWIQEGLCSLVEEYTTREGGEAKGTIQPLSSWRTNMAKRMLRSGKLVPLKELATMPREQFTGSRALGNYAHGRSIFLYLYEQKKLGDWYRLYLSDRESGYAMDPSGVAAIEKVLEKPIVEIDKDFRAWLRALPDVAEQGRPGSATLGVDVDPGTGDGPRIMEIGSRSTARKAGLRKGDVITAINDEPCRDLNELVRLLGDFQPGDEVKVSYRRGSTHGEARVKLTPR